MLQCGGKGAGSHVGLFFFAGPELQHEDASADICTARSVGSAGWSACSELCVQIRHFELTSVYSVYNYLYTLYNMEDM